MARQAPRLDGEGGGDGLSPLPTTAPSSAAAAASSTATRLSASSGAASARRIFGAQTAAARGLGGLVAGAFPGAMPLSWGQQLLPPALARTSPCSLALAVSCALLLLATGWRVLAGSGAQAAGLRLQVATLEAALASLEARHSRDNLDMSQHVQQVMSDQFASVLQGPLLQRSYPPVFHLPAMQRKRILVTGGAGFVGSHLVDALMMQGHYVYVLDNLFTGRHQNVEHWVGHPHFLYSQADVTNAFYMVRPRRARAGPAPARAPQRTSSGSPTHARRPPSRLPARPPPAARPPPPARRPALRSQECDQIYHLACPASPPHYQYNPIKTIKTSAIGTLNMLGLAKRVKARLLFASTSEVYGDPLVHPQVESYNGNVNTMGPRACYDEGKRLGETLCYSYSTEGGVETRIARIFNTFGPRMRLDDGRVVSNFITQALQGRPLTIHGDGLQTRSFQYVSDLVIGLIKLMHSDESMPVNLGNPDEHAIADFASRIIALVDPAARVEHLPATQDDPQQRKPDISKAKRVLGWEPRTKLDEGLFHAVKYFRRELGLAGAPGTDEEGGGGGGGGGGEAAAAAAAYASKDLPPIYVASAVNAALTDAERGIDVDGVAVARRTKR